MRSLAEYRAILKKKGFRYSFQEAWRKNPTLPLPQRPGHLELTMGIQGP